MNELADAYRDGLLQDVIPFWLKYGVDHEFGGIMTSVDRDGGRLDLHRDGTVSNRSKGNMWKGPFHLPRMQLICWRLWTNQNALEPGKFED